MHRSAFVHGMFPEAVEGADLDGWRAVFDTDVFGTMALTQEIVPHMKRQRRDRDDQHAGDPQAICRRRGLRCIEGRARGCGKIPGARARRARYPRERHPHGLEVGVPTQAYFRQAAAEYGMTEDAIIAPIASNIALAKLPTDDDCARAALFLASDDANAVTGATLDANGCDFMP